MGEAKKILGMEVTQERGSDKLWLSQENYILKVLERFKMAEVRPVTTPLADHFKLSSKQYPQSLKEEMSQVPDARAVGSLMYAMVCTKPDSAYRKLVHVKSIKVTLGSIEVGIMISRRDREMF